MSWAGALVLAAGLLAGCGSGDETGPESGGAAAGGAGFPVTITHKLGTTTIKSAPKRIVALGEADQDALLALGVQPVGMVKTLPPSGIAPWAQAKLSSAKPTLLEAGDSGFSLEKIAALKPDLILANFDYTIDKEYAKLSQLAPTTGYEVGPSEDSWQAVTRQVGKAIGKSAEAEKVVAAVEAQIASVKTKYPELNGKKFALTSVFPSGNIGVMKSPTDTTVKLFQQFGMELPASVQQLKGEGFAAEISMEQIKVLDTDVLLSHYNDDAATQRKIEGNALFKQLNVVKRGSYIPLDLKSFWPLRAPTALAVPYIVDNIVPEIAKAAKAEG